MISMIFLCLGLCSTAWSSRKSDIIRLLIIESRFEEARLKCTKWKAQQESTDSSLREFCAQAHWPKAEAINTTEVWQTFQDDWSGTDWAKKAFEREGIVALEALGEDAPEQAFLDLVDQFAGYKVATEARQLAGYAAVRDASSETEAKQIAREYKDHPALPSLVEKYPNAFFTVRVDGNAIVIQMQPKIDVTYGDPFWAFRSNEGQVIPWDEAVKAHLEDAGIEKASIMRVIQNNESEGPAFSLCPIPGATDGNAGIAFQYKESHVFEAQAWDAGCNQESTAIAMFSRKQLQYISFAPEYEINLGRKSSGRRNFTSFVRRTGDAILYKDRIFVPVGTSFVNYPLSGAAPWLTDKPPGALRYSLDSTLRGTGIPKGWEIKGMEDGIRVSTQTITNWMVPMGELRFFSPLVLSMLGLDNLTKAELVVPFVEWEVDSRGVSAAPLGSIPIDVTQLSSSDIKSLRYHIGGAGIDTSKMKVSDGFSVDLDDDGKDEKVLRVLLNDKEAVLILDSDDTFGNRTFIYSTKHAKHGEMAAPQPSAIKVGEQIVFYWSGRENKKSYLEVLYSQAGSFVMKE